MYKSNCYYAHLPDGQVWFPRIFKVPFKYYLYVYVWQWYFFYIFPFYSYVLKEVDWRKIGNIFIIVRDLTHGTRSVSARQIEENLLTKRIIFEKFFLKQDWEQLLRIPLLQIWQTKRGNGSSIRVQFSENNGIPSTWRIEPSFIFI